MGPIFSPNLVVGAKLQTDLTFTYGFDLNVSFHHSLGFRRGADPSIKVPNNSTIILDIGNVTNSSITGLYADFPPQD